ncbi:MAG: hypothetical protein IIU14_07925 [Ruminococcus sp.]|nr:hypothetical protein [Ruminococcus sp.]
MADYDITAAFEAIENELIDSMMKNFSRHRAEETELGYNWSQWQAEQLRGLEEYRRKNKKQFSAEFSELNGKISEMIRLAHADGEAAQEVEILKAIQNGFKAPTKPRKSSVARFFKVNDRKLDSLIKATENDLQRAEYATLRRANDQYRKAIFNAQVYANTGAGTYEKAVDMAVRDMLRAGLNSIEYKNGARHTLSDYADMAVRTANKRAYLSGEGKKRAEWGISTVIINRRQGGCPRCARFIGKIYIDDVWSGGKKSGGKYPLLSSAIDAGLYHPRCKDSHSTYFEGITRAEPLTSEEMAQLEENEKLEQQEDYYNLQAEKNGRIAEYSLDKEDKKTYSQRAASAEKKADEIRNERENVQEYEKAKTIKDAEKFALKYSQSDTVTIDSRMKLEIVNGFNKAANKVYQRFGRRIKINGIKPVKTANSKYEQASYNPKNGVLSLKNSSIETYRKNAEKYFANGWNASKDQYGTFYHEIGHAVWEDLTREAKNQISAIYRREKRNAYLKWMEMGGSSSGKSQADVFQKSLSRYAHTSTEEFFSEAFSQIMSGRARPISREVNAILNEKYRLVR